MFPILDNEHDALQLPLLIGNLDRFDSPYPLQRLLLLETLGVGDILDNSGTPFVLLRFDKVPIALSRVPDILQLNPGRSPH